MTSCQLQSELLKFSREISRVLFPSKSVFWGFFWISCDVIVNQVIDHALPNTAVSQRNQFIYYAVTGLDS